MRLAVGERIARRVKGALRLDEGIWIVSFMPNIALGRPSGLLFGIIRGSSGNVGLTVIGAATAALRHGETWREKMQMRWLIGVVWALAAGLAIAAASTDTRASDALVDVPVLKAAFGCKLTDGQLVCGNTKKGTKNKGVGSEGERACPPGYVVLAEKNEYGAFCELKEGLPAPAPAEAEKCPFGMIGTPPNDCDCPAGTDFKGYKGCVASRYTCVTDSVVKKDGGYLGQGYSLTTAAANESEARSKFFDGIDRNGWKLNGKVTCKEE